MKISVIIPYSHRGKQLELCLEGLYRQTMPFEDYEIIIVGEADLQVLERGDMIVRYLPFDISAYPGFPYALMRNAGAEEAVGDVLVFLDCDMILCSDFLMNTWQEHKEQKKLSFALRKKLPKDSIINRVEDVKKYRCDRDERELACAFFGGDYKQIRSLWLWVYSHTLCINRDAFFESGKFCVNFTGWGLEDSELAYRVMLCGIAIVCDHKSKCYHIWHQENFNKNKVDGYRRNLAKFRTLHKDAVLEGMDLCADCMEPGNLLRLISNGMSPQALPLFLYESYVRGYLQKSS